MTEENARHGDAGTPEIPPAGDSGERSTPAAPVPPPKPSTPPTSATPIVPPGATAGQAAAADPETATEPGAPSDTKAGSSAISGALTAGRSGAAGAAKLASNNAARLGRWVRRQSPPRIGAAAVVIVVVGLLAWLLAATLGGSKPSEAASSTAAAAAQPAPPSRGPLPLESLSPLDFQLGDCFKDFDPDAPQSTVVACDTGHSAQLVAIEQYAAPEAYPGRDQLKERARDACKASTLAGKSGDYDLSYKLAYPSPSSWEKGDRRVDCYVVANTGNVINETLLP